MVTRYNVLKQIPNFNLLISLGIMPMSIVDWIVMYEYYLDEKKIHKKMQSYSNTAENYKVNETTIRRIVCWMEGC